MDMNPNIKEKIYNALRWSEQYTKTDMIYFVGSNFWLTLGRVIAVGSGFILTVAFANLLSPTSFGTYKYVLAAAGIISAFSLNGLGSAIFRAISKGQKDVTPKAFKIGILWSLPASLATILISLYYFIKGNTQLATAFLFIAATNPLLSNLGIAKSLFPGVGDFKQATFFNIPRTIIPIIAILATLFATQNVLAVLFMYFFSNTIVGWIFYKISIKKLSITEKSENVEEVVSYGKHMSILGGLQIISSYIDQMLLWHFVGPVALASYAIAYGPIREIRTLVDNIGIIAMPKFAKRDPKMVASTIPSRTKQMFLLLLATTILYIFAAPFLFKIFFPQYISSIFISQLLAISILFQPRNLADQLLFVHGNIKDRYLITIPSQIIRLALLIILVPAFGLIGAVSAIILSEFGNALVIAYAYKRFSKL
jgi:polysaccharide biosynthesis protein VpsE